MSGFIESKGYILSTVNPDTKVQSLIVIDGKCKPGDKIILQGYKMKDGVLKNTTKLHINDRFILKTPTATIPCVTNNVCDLAYM
jgi:hypothetical protein